MNKYGYREYHMIQRMHLLALAFQLRQTFDFRHDFLQVICN